MFTVYKTKSTNSKNKKTYIFLLVLLLLILLFTLEKTGVTNFYQKPVTTTPQATEDTINYNPPTEAEATAGEEQKQKIVEQQTQTLPSSANVVIVDANQYGDDVEVRAFISNFIEDGKCNIAFTNGSSSFEKEVPAFGDASTTPCVTLTLKKSDFSTSGTWNVEVAYTGKTVSGSASTTLEIQ